jgi:hypothetical protein
MEDYDPIPPQRANGAPDLWRGRELEAKFRERRKRALAELRGVVPSVTDRFEETRSFERCSCKCAE